MALLGYDSWDHDATADLPNVKWPTLVKTGTFGTITVVPGAGRRSTQALRVTYGASGAGGTGVQRTQTPAVTFISGVSVRPEVAPAAVTAIMQLWDSAGLVQAALVVLPDFRLAITRGDQTGPQILVTSAPQLAIGTATHVQALIVVNGTTGSAEIKVNNGSVASLPLGNTQATANANWASMQLGLFTATQPAGGLGHFYDDFYLCDESGGAPWNTFLGDVSADVRKMTAEGMQSEWAPSTGTNNAVLVADADPATFVSAGAAPLPLTDTHVVEDVTLGGLLAMQIVLVASKSDSGACTIVPVVRSGAAVYDGTPVNPSMTPAMSLSMFPTDPATGALWAVSGFNAIEPGYKRTV